MAVLQLGEVGGGPVDAGPELVQGQAGGLPQVPETLAEHPEVQGGSRFHVESFSLLDDSGK